MNQVDVAKLLLRVTLGVLMLFHGIAKITGGIGFIEGLVTSHGLPSFIAWGVYVGEILAPLALIVGWQARAAAGVIAFNMLVAVWLVHTGELLSLGEHGGWALEVQAFYLVTALVAMLLGPGKYSLQK